MQDKEYHIIVSVVIPVFMSSQALYELFERLMAVLNTYSQDWEIIMVDDASTDQSYDVMQKLRATDKRVKIIQLAKNFGQHHATLCGLRHASGKYIITMDDDLQHPPEEIPKILSKLDEGYDVVFGRIGNKKHNIFRNMGSRAFQFLNAKMAKKPKDVYTSSFKGLTKHTVNLITTNIGPEPFIEGIIFRSVPAASITNVDFKHAPRKHGRSGYTLLKLLRLSFRILCNHSNICSKKTPGKYIRRTPGKIDDSGQAVILHKEM